LSKSIEDGEWVDEVVAIEALSCPLALGAGEHDVIVNREYIRKAFGDRIRGRKLQIIPDAGHSAHMENPDAFNRWVEEFVDEML
jgi:pimeloyl-ACP methyl ester carboxylesterase